jgi:predicted nuclease of predicted toxin-antitoxin system
MRLHLDEDADAHALLNALRHRGLDVTSTRELGLLRCSDEEQLAWAFEGGRVIYTYNASDFCRLHSEFMRQGRHHAGIIIGDQQAISIGEEMRRLLRISDARTAAEMADNLEFLGNWSLATGR